MSKPRKIGRAKISTTIAEETYRYLARKVSSGEAATLAEAIDASVRVAQRIERRFRLAKATANYFDCLEPEAAQEENALARDLASSANGMDFDKEL
jgi:predicted AAA+ superfamily ATPase